MKPFNFHKNRDRILAKVNEHLKMTGISDPEGFTLLEGFVAPVIHTNIQDQMHLEGRLLPQIAVIGKKSGAIYYFYLDILFPGEGLD